MTCKVIGRRIIRLGAVTSTMAEAARLGDAGEPEGTVVLAAAQTDGRGRAGRAWDAPPGTAVLASVLLRPPVPPARLSVLSLLVGVAAAEAIEQVAGLPCRLKWPNDLWLGSDDPGRKAGGILLTSRLGADGVNQVVAGIGINVTALPEDLPPGATSLAAELGRAVDCGALISCLIERLDCVYAHFLSTAGHPNLGAWRRRAALIGQVVSILDGNQCHTGRFTGVDDDGRLLLQTGDGEPRRIVAGDLVRGPRSAMAT